MDILIPVTKNHTNIQILIAGRWNKNSCWQNEIPTATNFAGEEGKSFAILKNPLIFSILACIKVKNYS